MSVGRGSRTIGDPFDGGGDDILARRDISRKELGEGQLGFEAADELAARVWPEQAIQAIMSG